MSGPPNLGFGIQTLAPAVDFLASVALRIQGDFKVVKWREHGEKSEGWKTTAVSSFGSPGCGDLWRTETDRGLSESVSLFQSPGGETLLSPTTLVSSSLPSPSFLLQQEASVLFTV